MNIWKLALSATAVAAILSGCGSGSPGAGAVAELASAGFTDPTWVGSNPETYYAKMGTCGVTLYLVDSTYPPSSFWRMHVNNIQVDGPTVPLLKADPRFAACFTKGYNPEASRWATQGGGRF